MNPSNNLNQGANLPSPPPPPPTKPASKLSTPVITNIVIISIVGFASILLMLFGDFESKSARIFSTLLVFAVFTFGSYWKNKTDSGVMVVQVLNIYMLTLSLILIWSGVGTIDINGMGIDIVADTMAVVILTQLGILITLALSKVISSPYPAVSSVAKAATVSMVITIIFFTLPYAFHDFKFGDAYWKVAVAFILLTALAISIMCILIWAYTGKKATAAPVHHSAAHHRSTPVPLPVQQQNNEATFQPAPAPSPAPAPPVQVFSTWPVFPNGQPLPPLADGRPNFHALLEVATSSYLLSLKRDN